MNPDLVHACLPVAQRITEQWRSSGLFGEKLATAPGASPQSQLLALLGRREDWKA